MDAGCKPPMIPWHITQAAFAAARKPTGWDDEDQRVVRAFWEAYAHAEDQLRQKMTQARLGRVRMFGLRTRAVRLRTSARPDWSEPHAASTLMALLGDLAGAGTVEADRGCLDVVTVAGVLLLGTLMM